MRYFPSTEEAAVVSYWVACSRVIQADQLLGHLLEATRPDKVRNTCSCCGMETQVRYCWYSSGRDSMLLASDRSRSAPRIQGQGQ
jgi:hypothetical protein